MRKCAVRRLGRIQYGEAFALQSELVAQRKQGLIDDQFLLVEHPHTITLGRNGKREHLLAGDSALAAAGIRFVASDRGGDITYHGPGQVVGYPIVDLRGWRRDVVAYVRALEQVMIDAIAGYGVRGERIPGCTGVWVDGAKIGAIGVHISRWVTSHGFALNVRTDLDYFKYIVPCGLARPVASLEQLGVRADMRDVEDRLIHSFGRVFDRELLHMEELTLLETAR
ncbi:MAG: lipoyl(octanoyl) transferase LipB [Bryobacteraceae bacterium]